MANVELFIEVCCAGQGTKVVQYQNRGNPH